MTNLPKKSDQTKSENYTEQLSVIMPRQNGTPAGLSALQASLLRGKEMAK
ncbi:hypothetical protein [Mucilaginibacter paludis]|uniref:Uncharacterized protein n=1 Tax=Mucilaginibacter paludis DSM 18603 TaxID=714943 RepID=H1Y7B4_9SPHI|nr:hypothetical protein [Mucilaginibacter paludis]EHQ29001.1 hypothetical protein Mucpa_4917 [Mucilaginibacter paludis DSM 18603]